MDDYDNLDFEHEVDGTLTSEECMGVRDCGDCQDVLDQMNMTVPEFENSNH